MSAGLSVFVPDQRDGVMPLAYVHALAELGLHGLVIVEPDEPFVSVGFFDDVEAAVDTQRCEALGLAVARRRIGGGPVLLGPGQVFYQLVLPRDSTLVRGSLSDTYKLLSEPVIAAYAKVGVPVTYKAVNDLVTADQRKISGQGAADIAGSFCFVGAVLRRFDADLMATVLRVPDEKMRDKLHRSLVDNVTSISAETGRDPGVAEVSTALIEGFEKLTGPLEPSELPAETVARARAICAELTSPAELARRTGRAHTSIKLREGMHTRLGSYKAPGGLIRAVVEVRDGVVQAVELTGDFTFVPTEAFRGLAASLGGVAFDARSVCQAVGAYMLEHGVDCPGVTPDDFAVAITGDAADPLEAHR
ncbi:MAG: lipoyl protein ligase domain-containing protein [Acidimicrobiales bacterium]